MNASEKIKVVAGKERGKFVMVNSDSLNFFFVLLNLHVSQKKGHDQFMGIITGWARVFSLVSPK